VRYIEGHAQAADGGPEIAQNFFPASKSGPIKSAGAP